jgi:hypothetical protein
MADNTQTASKSVNVLIDSMSSTCTGVQSIAVCSAILIESIEILLDVSIATIGRLQNS